MRVCECYGNSSGELIDRKVRESTLISVVVNERKAAKDKQKVYIYIWCMCIL